MILSANRLTMLIGTSALTMGLLTPFATAQMGQNMHSGSMGMPSMGRNTFTGGVGQPMLQRVDAPQVDRREGQ